METVEVFLTKENIDRIHAGQSTSIPFMKITDRACCYQKAVAFERKRRGRNNYYVRCRQQIEIGQILGTGTVDHHTEVDHNLTMLQERTFQGMI